MRVGVVASIATVALAPQRLGHKLADDSDVEAADFAHRHFVEFQMGRQGGVIVYGENHLFR